MTKPLPKYDHEKSLTRKNTENPKIRRNTVYSDLAKKIIERYEISITSKMAQDLQSAHDRFLIGQKSTERLSVKERRRYFDRIKKSTDSLIEAIDGLEPGLQQLLIENSDIPYDEPWMETLLGNLDVLRDSLTQSENAFYAKDHYDYTALEGFIAEMGSFFYERIDDSTFLPITLPTENSPDNPNYGRFVDFLMFAGAELDMNLEARKLAYAVHNFNQKKLKPK